MRDMHPFEFVKCLMVLLSYLALSTQLAGCYVNSEREVIGLDRAVNPWGERVLVFSGPNASSGAEVDKAKTANSELIFVFQQDNQVQYKGTTLRMAESPKLTEHLGQSMYLLSIPHNGGNEAAPRDQASQFLIFLLRRSEAGDVGLMMPSYGCRYTPEDFAQAEEAILRCVKESGTDFKYLLLADSYS